MIVADMSMLIELPNHHLTSKTTVYYRIRRECGVSNKALGASNASDNFIFETIGFGRVANRRCRHAKSSAN